MVVCILRNTISTSNNFVELGNGIRIITTFIIGLAQIVIIGIAPFTAFTIILRKVRYGVFILL